MEKKQALKYLFIITFTSALILSYLTYQPTTRIYHTKTLSDYCVLIGLWLVTFCTIFTIYKQTKKIKIGQILDALTTGLSSTSLSTFILEFYPQFTGQRLTNSNNLTYSLPIQIITTIILFWLSTKTEKTNNKPNLTMVPR
ncbi:MAG: hypothetical protein FWG55_00490 [Candidatus Bathyarchaeota archaeon]|nr:hypothetical protein [Candidatus Termiticorpusculum sp.]